jgi:hypothetical protein
VADGIVGLRADFAQGLPPPVWEYIITRTRARRWDFTFMAESLDGGRVGYRSARHFDVLNESLVRDLHRVTTARDFEALFGARGFYRDTLILLNTTSQDEDTYRDPYEGALRFAVNSAMYGVTLIFPGQELGLTGTIVPPSDKSNPTAGAPFGYDRYETDPNFHKPIPQFLTYNSMMPLWRQLEGNAGDARHLLAFYSAISHARAESPALRSNFSAFLKLLGSGQADKIRGWQSRAAGRRSGYQRGRVRVRESRPQDGNCNAWPVSASWRWSPTRRDLRIFDVEPRVGL